MSKTNADICRERGWTVGTRLAGPSEHGHHVIEITITAIGEQIVLGRAVRDGELTLEAPLWLSLREWKEIHASSVDLERLQEETNYILMAADCVIDDAYNPGDLKCIDAQWVVDVEGHAYHRVVVSEASPDASKLRQHVFEQLAEKGFPEVEVVTEW